MEHPSCGLIACVRSSVTQSNASRTMPRISGRAHRNLCNFNGIWESSIHHPKRFVNAYQNGFFCVSKTLGVGCSSQFSLQNGEKNMILPQIPKAILFLLQSFSKFFGALGYHLTSDFRLPPVGFQVVPKTAPPTGDLDLAP